jgi:hypothetical protein
MSALGQKRTWRDQIAMSALPPKAATTVTDRRDRFGPILFSNSGLRCQALRDHPYQAQCSLRGRDVPSA